MCNDETKKCSTCNETKPLSEFYTYKSSDGKIVTRSQCKICTKETTRRYREKHRREAAAKSMEWKLNNPEKSKASNDLWRSNNSDKMLGYAYKWAESNPEKAKAAKKAWRERNKEKIAEYQRDYNKRKKEEDTP